MPRWAIAVGDQGVVALTNLALAIAVTRSGGIDALGQYALISTTMLLALGISRMLVTEPWLASRSREAPGPQMRGLVLACSLASAIVIAIVVAVVAQGYVYWYLVVPVGAAWILQDAGRFAAYKASRPMGALHSDALLLVGVLAGMGFSIGVWRTLPLWAVLVSWAFGQALALAVIRREVLGSWALRGGVAWWKRTCQGLSIPLMHDGIAYMVAVNASLYLLAGVASGRDVGLVRVVGSLFSPVALAFTGLTMWLVPLLSRRTRVAGLATQKRVSLILAAGAVPLLVVVVTFGPLIATAVFGNEASPSRVSLLIGGVSTALVAVGSPWVAGAKVQGVYRPVAWARSVMAAATIGALLFLEMAQGVDGYLLLLLAQNFAVVVCAVTLNLRNVAPLT